MVTERAELQIAEGRGAEFEQAMRDVAIPFLKRVDGVEAIRFGRGIENPDRYMILVEWTSLDHHARLPDVPGYDAFLASFQHSVHGEMQHFALEAA